MARKFAREEIIPAAPAHDRSGEVSLAQSLACPESNFNLLNLKSLLSVVIFNVNFPSDQLSPELKFALRIFKT